MPVHRGKDTSGSYYQFGEHGYKYYYISNNKHSRTNAKYKAGLQGKAQHANKRII